MQQNKLQTNTVKDGPADILDGQSWFS